MSNVEDQEPTGSQTRSGQRYDVHTTDCSNNAPISSTVTTTFSAPISSTVTTTFSAPISSTVTTTFSAPSDQLLPPPITSSTSISSSIVTPSPSHASITQFSSSNLSPHSREFALAPARLIVNTASAGSSNFEVSNPMNGNHLECSVCGRTGDNSNPVMQCGGCPALGHVLCGGSSSTHKFICPDCDDKFSNASLSFMHPSDDSESNLQAQAAALKAIREVNERLRKKDEENLVLLQRELSLLRQAASSSSDTRMPLSPAQSSQTNVFTSVSTVHFSDGYVSRSAPMANSVVTYRNPVGERVSLAQTTMVPTITRGIMSTSSANANSINSTGFLYNSMRTQPHLHENPQPVHSFIGNSTFNVSHAPLGGSAPSSWLFNQSGLERMEERRQQANVSNFFEQESQMTMTRLTREQIAARQVVPRDLPTFDGNPEDWPKFIRAFLSTTEMCGFRHYENLERLERSLKGKALKAVQGLISIPDTVPDAIEVLRELYGNPEDIVERMESNLLAHPKVNMERLDTVIEFSLAVQNHCYKVRGMGMSHYLANDKLVRTLAAKLSFDARIEWSRASNGRIGNLSDFSRWLSDIARHAIRMRCPDNNVKPQSTRNSQDVEKKVIRGTSREKPLFHVNHDSSSDTQPNCLMCSGNHFLNECSEFTRLERSKRWDFVKTKGLCQRCFKTHHVRNCRSKRKCGENNCQMRHHPLLHYVPDALRVVSRDPPVSKVTTPPSNDTTVAQIHCHARQENATIFRIVPVTLFGEKKSMKTFAFVDEGSSVTLIDEDLANELDLRGPADDLLIGWTGEVTRTESNSRRVSLRISGVDNQTSQQFRIVGARTVRKLNLPVQTADPSLVGAYNHLIGLPIQYYRSARPRLLIGLDNYHIATVLEAKEGNPGEPIAVRTRLGWMIYGQRGMLPNQVERNFHICHRSPDDDLHALVKNFFSVDSFGVSSSVVPVESKENLRSRQIMEQTTRYNGERYEVGLLWRCEKVKLPDSYPMARRRLICLESKLARDSMLAKLVDDKVADYLRKGYVRKLEPHEITTGPKVWYLPIFTVANKNKNKIRIVWDAAAKVGDVSLNSALMKGPDQYKSLFGILLRFRERRVAICGDIKEMFHQVRVVREDHQSQRFLWRNGDRSRSPDVYCMEVMTFGASCSPSLAQYIKNLNARKFEQESPRAVLAIVDRHYVDDWLDSVDCEEEMIQLIQDVKRIHHHGGFEIRNFISNSSKVLEAIGCLPSSDKKSIDFESTYEKVLGLVWFPSTDEFGFGMCLDRIDPLILDGSRAPTKREVLRVIMTVFDPLGFLSTFMVHGKILLQEIWRTGVSWDDPIPQAQLEKWYRWTQRLKMVRDVKIPRCYPQSLQPDDVQLHVFVDASTTAFAAAVFIRVVNDGVFQSSLICSKTKVAPQNPMSVPRLELLAAVLGARLGRTVVSEHSIKFNKVYFWTDSSNVLSWIRSDARNYKQFVAFRIAELLDLTEVGQWRWVPSRDNVADEATKWFDNYEIDGRGRWFMGPSLLREAEDLWPTQPNRLGSNPEELVCHTTVAIVTKPSYPALERCFTWTRMRNCMSFVLRFLNNMRAKRNHDAMKTGPLSPDEILDGESRLFRLCQVEHFPKEMTLLQSGLKIDRTSPVYRYSPYLDDAGVMRMCGRIDAMEGVVYSVKRPIILPRDHFITRLIIEHVHRRFLHKHVETVVNEIRQQFVISKLRALINSIIRGCQHCKNLKPKIIYPQMGDLPTSRLQPLTRPFTFTGMDLFGPLFVSVGRRCEKRWGLLLTCMTFRAAHLEVCHDLTTSSCLLAFQRFVDRRGVPMKVFSDQGTNFRGASRIFQEARRNIEKDKLAAAYPKTEWLFIPPASPHMGGCWERMIRTVKSLMMEVLPTDHKPTDEVLSSVFTGVECIVNSRPLTYVPLSHEDDEPLTPNHYLLGSSGGVRSMGEFVVDGATLAKYWRVAQHITDKFNQRWIREVLPLLTRRVKWLEKPVRQLEIGDVVVIIDENAPRNIWIKGRIIEVNTGRNQQVRSATVQTKYGVYTRPAIKLALLDLAPPPMMTTGGTVDGVQIPEGGVVNTP